jgi:hypothetical protein
MTKITQSDRNYSFHKGYSQIALKDTKKIRREIMDTLGRKENSSQWYQRLRGDVEPKISEVHAIEAIFAKYRITDIWDDPTTGSK